MGQQSDIDITCAFLRSFSMRTWLHLKLVREQAFRFHETTITQNLVKDFWIESRLYHLPVKIYESTKEHVNGNDLEILIETVLGYIMLPVQVKVIKENNKYSGIAHVVRGKPQIDLLIDYAAKRKGIPAYLFYNYYDDYDFYDYVYGGSSPCCVEEFGCTIGSAVGIRDYFFERNGLWKWQVPTFEDLHMPVRFATPLHWVFGELLNAGHKDLGWLNDLQPPLEDIHYYSAKELAEDTFWREMFPPAKISGIPDQPLMGDPMESVLKSPPEKSYTQRYIAEELSTFTPQYRIVISRKKEKTGIVKKN